ncbi:hypothetical protein GW17_00054828, partial [Ensete ventricosum]
MATNNLIKPQLEALETRIENRLEEILNEFKRGLLKNFSKQQQDQSLSLALNRSRYKEIRHQEHDTSYPCMKVEFSRWKDGDPTSWISRVEFFFRFHRTPK